MSGHASAELLSAYLDDGLEPRRAERLEVHLEECDRCRTELEGLRRVVLHLQAVEREAPPPALGYAVRRRVASEHVSGSLSERLQMRRAPVRPQVGLLAFLGPLLGLTVILLLFLQQVQRRQAAGPTLIIHQPAALEEPVEPVGASAAESTSRRIGARQFHVRNGIWIEQGAERTTVSRVIDMSAAEPGAGTADLKSLAILGERVVVWLDGEAVELRFASEPE